jgi:hypothetical protein
MGCRTVRTLHGVAIVCDCARRPKPCSCGRPGDFLCDWIIARAGGPNGKKGGRKRDKRCSRPICPSHAEEVAADKHLCPAHAEAYRAWLDRQHAAVAPGGTEKRPS